MSRPHAAPGRRSRGLYALTAVMALGAVAMVAPFVWMLLTSLKSPSELTEFSWLPDQLRFQNYTEALTAAPFARYFLNTAVLTIGQTALTLLFATSAGYALACTPIRGRKALNAFVVILIMVPFYAILIPEFLVVKSIPLFGGNSITGQGGIGWLNSWWGLIIPHAIAPIYIFLARQFFVSLPEELAEAARVDGLSEYGIFFRIMLPLIKPAVITVAVFQIGAAWNSFLWPLLITRDDSLRPIQVGLAIFSQDPLNVQWAYLMAGATLAVLPMIALFIAAQRYFIEGMASAGLKG
ncbi:carbohydrate ABC transporter membrane protein 2 (CUT1 family) [Humibacillus xanthopallidus]|uniref:Carbohydrate ABC transporter membrane protein 2 (CUT1 family) n=2 Tax=Humibacillus xanthopallidus TaxID=412689 RepID=A0A543HZK2_9MICO|nr:carbohydrate ABC transporter membrane protein 2 (CUT1 family) [Humibacillus xanthopallidus]